MGSDPNLVMVKVKLKNKWTDKASERVMVWY